MMISRIKTNNIIIIVVISTQSKKADLDIPQYRDNSIAINNPIMISVLIFIFL